MNWVIGGIITICLMSFKADKKGHCDFKIVSAEKQTVFGGIAGSPVVTTYKMQIIAKKQLNFRPDSAWTENKVEKVLISLDSFRSSESHEFKKGDTIRFYFSIRSESEIGGGDYQLKIPGSKEEKSPIDNKNKILIRYQGGKCKYLIISDIELSETIFAP